MATRLAKKQPLLASESGAVGQTAPRPFEVRRGGLLERRAGRREADDDDDDDDDDDEGEKIEDESENDEKRSRERQRRRRSELQAADDDVEDSNSDGGDVFAVALVLSRSFAAALPSLGPCRSRPTRCRSRQKESVREAGLARGHRKHRIGLLTVRARREKIEWL
jgi:hypothetical protein